MSAWANIRTIAKRELLGYFASPVAYVFIVIFLLLTGFFTFMLGGFLSATTPHWSPSSFIIRGSTCFWCRRRGCGCGRKSDGRARWSYC